MPLWALGEILVRHVLRERLELAAKETLGQEKTRWSRESVVLVVRGETGGMKIALEIQLGMGILSINGSLLMVQKSD